MADFVPLHADKPGSLTPRDVSTKRYRALQDCGPFKAGNEFTAWPYGEKFASVSNPHGPSGPVCTNGQLADWLKSKALELR